MLDKFLKTLCIICLLFISQKAAGQATFQHSMGINLTVSKDAFGVGYMYSPRVNVLYFGYEGSLSVGTNLQLGFGTGWSYKYESSPVSLMIDFPIVANINLGHAADEDADSGFGAYAGVGFGLNRVKLVDYYGNRAPLNIGPYFDAGLRFLVLGTASMYMHASYLRNIQSGGASVLSLGMGYTFGYW